MYPKRCFSKADLITEHPNRGCHGVAGIETPELTLWHSPNACVLNDFNGPRDLLDALNLSARYVSAQ
jgi:hypothetical protein